MQSNLNQPFAADKRAACRVRPVWIRLRKFPRARGFALVITLSLMVLITIIAVGMLSLATVELRRSAQCEARTVAMANARLGLTLALGRLQEELGDDRRISADAAVLANTKNPSLVGVWNGWSPDLASRSGSTVTRRIDYRTPKEQAGFRGWLVSDPDLSAPQQLAWHLTQPAQGELLFTRKDAGIDLEGRRIPVTTKSGSGSLAWAVCQENTKAKVNIGTDDAKRQMMDERLQAPSRPNLALSSILKQPENGWLQRPARVCSNPQMALDPAYGIGPAQVGQATRDYTVHALSLLTNPVTGGLKTDLSSGFEMADTEFSADSWPTTDGSVSNPFRGTALPAYQGQKPLFQPLTENAEARILMNYAPVATVTHRFQVNGVPTFETLRSHYRTYRHLYKSSGADVTAFERPYSYISTPQRVSGRPFGRQSQPSVAPVLDRLNLLFSLYAKSDGTLGILLSPLVTLWNPYNVDIETEGVVVYPWIDFAIFWNWSVTTASGQIVKRDQPQSLAAFLGEGRSACPYFYLHLTEGGSDTVTQPIQLKPGEVRVFCLANPLIREFGMFDGPESRTWHMKPVASPSDISASIKGGLLLNMTRGISSSWNFAYKLQPGDRLNSSVFGFEGGSQYQYFVNMADAWQIHNPGNELMVEDLPRQSVFPFVRAEPNLYFHSQINSGTAYAGSDQSFSYPSFLFEEIRERPRLVGSLLTYHRVAKSGKLPLSDLMYTTNPRQPFVNSYLSNAKFRTGPHYDTVMQQGGSLAQLAMETSYSGKQAFYGPSHSASDGRTHLAFFELPQGPALSLGAFQHCDITGTAFGPANQIGNSWATPYLPAIAVSKLLPRTSSGEAVGPGLAVYDSSYLVNEALFDSCFLSGATPEFGARQSTTGSSMVWQRDQLPETTTIDKVLERFFAEPLDHPLRNLRMVPHHGGLPAAAIAQRLQGPAKCARLAGNLMVDGGFNINSTSEEAWAAVIASLRGVDPASADKSPQSRFRHILVNELGAMKENDPWNGFRALTDKQIKTLAKNIVLEIKLRGPFLSLGEFVNRRVGSDLALGVSGAIQAAIDKSDINAQSAYTNFQKDPYPNPENLSNPNTGTNTPGWLTQADVLNALAPFITPRSDTFVIRSLGEAKDAGGKVTARVRLEATVQRVPDWLDPADDPATPVAALKSAANRNFGRRFVLVSIRELPSPEAM